MDEEKFKARLGTALTVASVVAMVGAAGIMGYGLTPGGANRTLLRREPQRQSEAPAVVPTNAPTRAKTVSR